MKKVYLTERQAAQILSELYLDGGPSLTATNGNMPQATKTTLDDARKSGVNPDRDDVSVSFSADNLRKNGIVAESDDMTKEVEDCIKTSFVDGKNGFIPEKKMRQYVSNGIEEFTGKKATMGQVNEMINRLKGRYLNEFAVYTKKQLKESIKK